MNNYNNMHNMHSGGITKKMRLFMFAKRHKLAFFVFLVALAFFAYYFYKNTGSKVAETTYRTASAEIGTISTIVSGSGQVRSLEQISIKPKVPGDVIFVAVSSGDEVNKGDLMFRFDSSSALRDLNNAETSLETIKLELEELLGQPTSRSISQAENNISTAKADLDRLLRNHASKLESALNSQKSALDSLELAYEDAFNEISLIFLDLPTFMTSLFDSIFGDYLGKSETSLNNSSQNIHALRNSMRGIDYLDIDEFDSFSRIAESSYKESRQAYNKVFETYKQMSRFSEPEEIEKVLDETIEALRLVSQSIKDATNMYDFWIDYRTRKGLSVFSGASYLRSGLSSLTSSVGSQLSRALSSQSKIRNYKETIKDQERSLKEMEIEHPLEVASAKRRIQELEYDFEELLLGPNEMSVRSKQIQLKDAEYKLFLARQSLADYFIYAPFDGVVASLGVSISESVSQNTELAKIITRNKIAEITLNEIDISKVKIGQKAVIFVDAVSDLEITGEVVEIDTVSTTTQGVVTYDVKVSFDLDDERIKPGMSVSVDIITERKSGVLTVPNSAIKSQGASSFVEIIDENGLIRRQEVRVGLSSETTTEILGGIESGTKVVTQTISSSSSSNTVNQTGSSLFPTGGVIQGAGGAGRLR